MQKKPFLYGKIYSGSSEDLFLKTVDLITQSAQQVQKENNKTLKIGLTGGSTPKNFYQWIVSRNALQKPLLDHLIWSVSDERPVPLEDGESNFGNADRLLLKPLNVAVSAKFPWPTKQEPQQAAEQFNQTWRQELDADNCFDICFLGMGDDAHTASLFPGNTLIGSGVTDYFAAVETAQKGWRLTITEAGLERCGQIIVTVIGENKRETLQAIFEEPYNPQCRPIQILRNYASKVIWLVDEACFPF